MPAPGCDGLDQRTMYQDTAWLLTQHLANGHRHPNPWWHPCPALEGQQHPPSTGGPGEARTPGHPLSSPLLPEDAHTLPSQRIEPLSTVRGEERWGLEGLSPMKEEEESFSTIKSV